LATRGSTSAKCSPFLIDVARQYEPGAVRSVPAGLPRSSDPQIEAAIQQTWERELVVATSRGRMLYDGELGRLAGFCSTAGSLQLELAATCYRDFVGTNIFNVLGVHDRGPEFLANPLGVSATVLTTDGFLVYGRRSDQVAYHGGYLQTFGGMLESPDRLEHGGYDVFGSCVREVMEELPIRESEITGMSVVGLVRDRRLLQPELLFELATDLPAAVLDARFGESPGQVEHQHLEMTASQPQAIARFINTRQPIAPIAQAAMLLHGLHRWGAGWYDQTGLVLFGEVPPVES
jgi:8-oxo-dGTP pyrophosphatase MutT (NUDIX family)